MQNHSEDKCKIDSSYFLKKIIKGCMQGSCKSVPQEARNRGMTETQSMIVIS